MSKQITVDGCDYTYMQSTHCNVEEIHVIDVNGEMVGSVDIDHNMEAANVEYVDGNNVSVNYFEFAAMTTPDVAGWIVYTNYV